MIRLVRDDRGAMSVVMLMFAVFLVALLYYLIGIGQALLYRERMQDAADAVAFSSAVMHARGMNLIALINVIMAALLAVLVAFRIVETLLLVAMVIIAAASVFPPNPGGFALVGTLETLRETVSEAREIAGKIVHPTLAMLHTTEILVRDLTPATATAIATDVAAKHYAPPAEFGVAVPGSITLPLEDAPFPVLCQQSASLVADLTLAPLEDALGGVGRVALGPVRSAVEGLASNAPDWFCGDGSARSAIDVDKGYPQLPAQAQCLAAIDGIDEAASTSVKDACDAAETETLRSAPDPDTGECLAPDCDRELYLLRAERARRACNPNEHRGLRDYVVQLRTTRYAFHKHLSLRRRPVASVELRLAEWNVVRCQREDGRWRWNERMHDENDEPLPVCTVKATTLRDMSVEVVDALHVFGCAQRTTLKPPVDNAGQGVAPEADGDPEAAQRLSAGVALGSEAFQIRGVVLGRKRDDAAQRVVEVATYGAPKPTLSELILPANLSRIAVAQAEYYFDAAGADPSAAMWEPKWKARLRRFRWPSEPTALDAACVPADAMSEDAGPSCSEMVNTLREAHTWIAH